MIKYLQEIRGFGIFNDYKKLTSLSEFNKFNLIYGWNGCGKTTLSRIFACLEKRKKSIHFDDCSFKIITDSCEVNIENLDSNSLNVLVFNQDFISDNINWNEVI